MNGERRTHFLNFAELRLVQKVMSPPHKPHNEGYAINRSLRRRTMLSSALLSAARSASAVASSGAACRLGAASSLLRRPAASAAAQPLSTAAPAAASSASAVGTTDGADSSASREVVNFLTLNNLSDNPGARRYRRRIGRGIGSSKGKTSGRGHKGQKARAGRGVHPTFEGGQTKLYKRLPKRGFTNVHAEEMVPINVGTLQDYIDMGRLPLPADGDQPLTIKDLVDAGITKASSVKHGIKLLGKGQYRLRSPIKIEVSRASDKAIAAIERAGGEITTVHYNRLALRALLKPEKFAAGADGADSEDEGGSVSDSSKPVVPRQARPPPKLMPYYTSYDKRGYLSPEVQLKKIEERLGAIKVVEEDAAASDTRSSSNKADA